jgi:hypothetical protein
MAGFDVETCFAEYQINLLEGHNRENFFFYQKISVLLFHFSPKLFEKYSKRDVRIET